MQPCTLAILILHSSKSLPTRFLTLSNKYLNIHNVTAVMTCLNAKSKLERICGSFVLFQTEAAQLINTWTMQSN